MNILKRQLALLLVLAMTLTMLPMPAHADEVTEPETKSAIVEETTEKTAVSNEVVPAETVNKPVENADSDTKSKETTTPSVEILTDNTVDFNAANTEEQVADVSADTPSAESVKESEAATDTGDDAENTEVDEKADFDATVESEEASVTTGESEEAEGSEADPQKETEQMESETETPVFAAFSFRRSAANAVADECEHLETEVAWDTKDQVINCKPISDTQHQISGYQYRYCTSCYERVGESFAVTEVGNHELDANGRCGMCGYNSNSGSGSGSGSDSDPNPDCDHANTAIGWDPDQLGPWYAQFSDTQHKVTGYRYTYCTDCGERIRDENGSNNNYYSEEYEEHSLNTSGKCFLCGYQSSENTGCAHNNTEVKFYYNNPVRYAQFNEEEHYIYRAGTIYCHDCRTDIGSSNTEQWSFEAHTLNDEGSCVYCGYGLGEGYCTHPNSRVIMDSDQEKAYYQKDEGQHLVNFYQYHYCPDCNSRISESFMDAAWEDHDFDASGVCTSCGYQSDVETACTHENTETAWDTGYPIFYDNYSISQHKATGYQYAYCTDCFERVCESFEAQEFENHTLDGNGICTFCGVRTTGCAHENKTNIRLPNEAPIRYAQFTDVHTIYLRPSVHLEYYTVHIYCDDCNTIISSYESNDTVPHRWNENNICVCCGYGAEGEYCTHPNTDLAWDTNYTMSYVSKDDYRHTVSGYQYHYCTNCFNHITASFQSEEVENHTFDSAGDCTLCDYRAGCTHSQTTTKLYDTLYESLNKDSHEITRLYSKVCADPVCGKVLVSVETSYTETDIEDHDFEGNTCHLCKYTVADQLDATVTASASTANKGERISASVSVIGGTGGYQYSWKVLKDGSVKAGSPITTDASYDYLANEEGSYVFQVTVTDSGGNTVTAQSGAITVSHGCQYETVSNTVLVNQSLTHHTVETTTYEECTICHEKRNEVTDVQWVEHTPIDAESYGHEAAHPHKKYFICECGAHPYLDGEYHTANGEVQDESVCCICHGHKFGAEEETDEDTRQKTCANCGIITVTHTHNFEPIETEKLINPDETKHERETTTYEKCKICGHEKPGIVMTIEEAHSPQNPDDYKFRDGHPHLRYAVCECGKEFDMQDEYKTANGTMQAPDVCCLCHGHVFGEPTEINSVIGKVICSVCGYEGRIAIQHEDTEEPEQGPTTIQDQKQEIKNLNIEFIKTNALGKDEMYTLFFGDELRAEIKKLSAGWQSKLYDIIDGDPSAVFYLSQADFYVDTLMKQCVDVDPDSNTISVSPDDFKSICEFLGLEDAIVDEVVKQWIVDRYTDKDGDFILNKKEFEKQIKKYDFKVAEWTEQGLDVVTYLWDCLSDISIYTAAVNGPASGMIDKAAENWRYSNIPAARAAAVYLEQCKNPALRVAYAMTKNADISEEARGFLIDTLFAAAGLTPSFEVISFTNDTLLKTNDILKSSHGAYWSLQMVDELRNELASTILSYEANPNDKNYTECVNAYSVYITYLISTYECVVETCENQSSTFWEKLLTSKEVKEQEKALYDQYKMICKMYEYDVKTAVDNYSMEQILASLPGGGGSR